MGQIKVQGEIWSAICREKKTFKVDETVVVDSIDGVKLVIKEYTE